MSEQPPVQPPDKPSNQPSNPPTSQPSAGNPPTQPMPAAGPPAVPPAPLAGSPVATASGEAPKPDIWHRTTSTHGGRWGLAVGAVALVCLLFLGMGMAGLAGLAVLRHQDRVDLVGHRQDGYSLRHGGPGNGGAPWANGKQDKQDRKEWREQPGMPGMQGGRAQGLGGLGNLLGGTALHGEVTVSANGSVQALVFQRGEVTAVSDTSITVKSSDGFVGTYGRTATTVSRGAAPVKGGQAIILARASDKVAITIMATPVRAGVAPSS